MTEEKFTRKIFSFPLFLKDSFFLLYKTPQIFLLLKSKKISRAFMEKIMSIVSSVNACTYCKWFHARQAIACGISKEEVKHLFSLQFQADASDYELTALLYAQHFAETNRSPNKEMTDQLFEFYGKKTAKQILLIIRMIFFGNLYGNTLDAFLSRLKGIKAEGSNIVFEFFFFLINSPIILPILVFSKK